jgi:hypothetical protein
VQRSASNSRLGFEGSVGRWDFPAENRIRPTGQPFPRPGQHKAAHIQRFSVQESARLRRPFERCRSELELPTCRIGPGGSRTESARRFSPPHPTECIRRKADKPLRLNEHDSLNHAGFPWTRLRGPFGFPKTLLKDPFLLYAESRQNLACVVLRGRRLQPPPVHSGAGKQTTIFLDLKFLTVPKPPVGMLSGERRNSIIYGEYFRRCGNASAFAQTSEINRPPSD